MADFDNLFDAAIARADETIRGYMGTSATITSGEQSGAVIRGVFDDPENISYAGQGVRVEGSSPSLFVRTDEVRQLRRGDTLTIGEENFWVDRVSPDDGGSCHLWLGLMSSCPYNWRNHGPSGPLFLCGGVHDER